MKGYKAFDENLKCRDFQFVVGETFTNNGKLELCRNGFHFCENVLSVYNYYNKDSNTRICEVVALGEIITEGDKSITNKIQIIRELSHKEILNFVLGNSNSGHFNSGSYNSGSYNSGRYNSGNSNSGSYNSGSYNSGNSNSGHFNSGNSNSGSYNSGNFLTGIFNNKDQYPYVFNKQVTDKNFDMKNTISKLQTLKVIPILQWVSSSNMTDDEKKNNPSYKTTGGYLKNTGKNDWTKLTEDNKKLILSLPNYDDDVFKDITGVSLLPPKTIKVVINGKEKEIDINKAKSLGLLED